MLLVEAGANLFTLVFAYLLALHVVEVSFGLLSLLVHSMGV